MAFQDYFSKQSDAYCRYRPTYPSALFKFIALNCTARHVVWDCATGNGQAALALADFFDRVIATDASEAQLSNAKPHDRVTYRTASAENSGLESESVNCVTVAQAVHWVDRDAFFKEVRRVLTPRGIIAVWSYPLMKSMEEKLNPILEAFCYETMAPYWAPERKIIDARYRSIDFPFDEIEAPLFSQEKHWSLNDLANYLATWSCVQRYKDQRDEDPIAPFVSKVLAPAWGSPETKKSFVFEFPMRIGQV